jgi:hypothetical protein
MNDDVESSFTRTGLDANLVWFAQAALMAAFLPSSRSRRSDSLAGGRNKAIGRYKGNNMCGLLSALLLIYVVAANDDGPVPENPIEGL